MLSYNKNSDILSELVYELFPPYPNSENVSADNTHIHLTVLVHKEQKSYSYFFQRCVYLKIIVTEKEREIHRHRHAHRHTEGERDEEGGEGEG